MTRSKGFTLIELIVVLVVLSILSAFFISTANSVIEQSHIEATVSEMKALANAAQIVKQQPGGGAYNNVSTTIIAAKLNSVDANYLGLSTTKAHKNHWGKDYTISTIGPFAQVQTEIPLRDINPHSAKATASGTKTVLNYWHRPSHNNSQVLNSSLANKRILYQE